MSRTRAVKKAKRLSYRRRQLIERWTQLARVLRELPEHDKNEHFDMISWGHETACGTVACAAGHAALDPWFQERGFSGALQTSSFVSKARLVFNNAGFWGNEHQCTKFFGRAGTQQIFLKTRRRSVLAVIREICKHVRSLSSQEQAR
jgi:hypothetical protein